MTDVVQSLPDALSSAQSALESGDLARAAVLYRGIAEQFPLKRQAVAAAAEGLRACGHFDEAISVLEASLERTPTSPTTLMALAVTYTEIKRFDVAATYVRRHIDRDPSNPVAWMVLGDCAVMAGDIVTGEDAYRRARSLKPMDADIAMKHGDVLFELDRNDEGILAYRHAYLIRPVDVTTLFKLGSALMHVNPEEAELLLRRALELDPSITPARINLATTLYHDGRVHDALEAARLAVASDASLPAAHATLGTILSELGQHDEAAEALRRVQELSPAAILPLISLATEQSALGLLFEAERTLYRVLSIEPENVEARHLLAALHGESLPSMPERYSEQLFDRLAARFDRLLSGPLQYRAHENALALLRAVEPNLDAFKNFLDLGCGTGTIGETIGDVYRIAREVGVDVSSKMLEIAQRKGVYDELIRGRAEDYLAGNRNTFDLITAIDLFPYVGDLESIVPLIADALTPNGLFIYTIESTEPSRYRLRPSGRFAHAPLYVDELALKAGLKPIAAKPLTLQRDRGKPVVGVVGALRR